MQTKIIASRQKSFSFLTPYDQKLSEALKVNRLDYLNNGVSFRRRSNSIQINLSKKQLININPLLKNSLLSRNFKQTLFAAYEQIAKIAPSMISMDYILLGNDLHVCHISFVSASGSLLSPQRRLEGFRNCQKQLGEINQTLQDIVYSLQQIQERCLRNKQCALAKQFQKNIHAIISMQQMIERLLMSCKLANPEHLEKQAKIILQKLTRLRFSAKYLRPFDFIQAVLDTEISPNLRAEYDPDFVPHGIQQLTSPSDPQTPNAAQNKPPLSDDFPPFYFYQPVPIIAKRPKTN